MVDQKNVLVIGSGGREHALCWKLADSPFVKQIYCAPGSVGVSTTNKVESVDLDIKNYQALAEWCKEKSIDLVVVGPEDPLANGIVDGLATFGVKCFGPPKAGAQIEANKDWAKAFMIRHQIPTARYKSFTDAAAAKEHINNATYPALVVKASGLAAGKGVVVATSKEEACQAVDEILTDAKYGVAGETVVVEELLEGEEVSVLAFTDGETVSMMPPAQDHKRLGNGDTGPNTGGMGAYCPCPLITPDQLLDVKDQVLQRAVDGLKAEGIKYVVQSNPGVVVFHSGVSRGANGSLVTAGGRVLLVCARAGALRAAAAAATAAAAAIDFPGKQINGLSYLQSGVDIDAAALLVRKIEPLATGTHRRGVLGRLGCFSGLGLRSKITHFRHQVETSRPEVMALTETFLTSSVSSAELFPPGYVVLLYLPPNYKDYQVTDVLECIENAICTFSSIDVLVLGDFNLKSFSSNVDVAITIVRGIADACIKSGCALLGGETAEMPSMYDVGKYDLAGFAVGVVDNHKQLPRTREIRAGDVVLALPSTGVHSNGYSLVQKIMGETGHSYSEKAPFSTSNKTFGEEFLEPTGLYVKALLPAVKKGSIKALAHITGGGLLENIPRILPAGVKVKLDALKFRIKPIFGWLQAKEAMAPLTAPYGATQAAAQKSLSYKDSGVDIEAGDSLDPVLVLASDGVGTKLKIAQKINQHSTIGIDLVAMCVNDILCNGACPLTFLDYFACGRLDVSVARSVVNGFSLIHKLVKKAGLTLNDKAPFSKEGLTLVLPALQRGLVKAVAHVTGGGLLDNIPRVTPEWVRARLNAHWWNVHPSTVLPALTRAGKAVAHVTGGGLLDNIPRVTPEWVRARLNAHWWNVHPSTVLPALTRAGKAVAHVTGGGLLDNIPRVTPEWVRARLNAHWWNVHPVCSASLEPSL
ncbi:hypothetical protein MSG28_010050 [Choristoneura fumiferana]|uniref:Uncharacterized protein n=1 Tax=Choristoneura fumiferana TaxID=7141 RepID=A0ACC0KJ27_CHOFU|nr:hypothetical protein MSG28_010050 [Choristoneura fumiferana]